MKLEIPRVDSPLPTKAEKPAKATAPDSDAPKKRDTRRRRGPYEDKSPTPMGLGDHLPLFIAQSFAERMQTASTTVA